MKTLTVILLTYNHEKTIAKAFESILEQETDFDFDIYVCEDCSTDRTADICREYEEKHPDKVRLFLNQKNLGVTQNFKQGLLNVKSKYFAVLEGDDYWCNRSKLQLQVNALEMNPDCVLCAHKTLYRDHINNTEWTVPDEKKYAIKQRYTINERTKVHASSRVYKNIIKVNDVPHFMFLDTDMLSMYLTKGDMIFLDRVMSVYNSTGNGYWSSKSMKKRRLINVKQWYDANKYLNFVCHGRYYTKSKMMKLLKFVFGVRLGLFFYYYLETARLHIRYMFAE